MPANVVVALETNPCGAAVEREKTVGSPSVSRRVMMAVKASSRSLAVWEVGVLLQCPIVGD